MESNSVVFWPYLSGISVRNFVVREESFMVKENSFRSVSEKQNNLNGEKNINTYDCTKFCQGISQEGKKSCVLHELGNKMQLGV